jgi:hypothetical protein
MRSPTREDWHSLLIERDRLKALCEELAGFLRRERDLHTDPQPGLFTWREAVYRLHTEIDAAIAKIKD